MGNVFICADLHFSHKNIIKYEDRPFADTEEMDRALILNWNSVVKEDDKVFVLGDVAFTSKAKTMELVRQLNGHKILVMGNHDRGRSVKFWLECGFDVVSPYPILYGGRYLLMHEPPIDLSAPTPYFHIYGHVHGSGEYKDLTDRSACVSIERINYMPALFEDVISGKAYYNMDKQRKDTTQ